MLKGNQPSQMMQRLTPARMLLFFYFIALLVSTKIGRAHV